MKRARKLLMVGALGAVLATSAHAASGKIVKTLPHYLDLQGRHMLTPSLFERDAYQANLKLHPELCSGMRFDVQWKAHRTSAAHPRLRLEVKAEKLAPRKTETFEQELKKPGLFNRWSGVTVAGEDFKRIGAIQAWRISLWDGETLLAEQKSFLW